MLRIMLLSISFSIIIFASPTQNLLYEIKSTYSKDFYKGLYSDNKSLTLANFENNSTQKKIKEDFERLIPKYFKADNLFIQENLKEFNTDDNSLITLNLQKFFVTCTLYIKLLDRQQKTIKSNQLFKKTLSDLNALMRNSTSFANYIISVILYKKFYSNIELNSLYKYAWLKKCPPPDKTIFFEKLKYEEQWVLNSLENAYLDKQVDKKDYNEKEFKKLMRQVNSTAKHQVKIYFAMMYKALKHESLEEIEKYNKFIETEGKKHMSVWNKIRFFLSTIKVKIFNIIFGYNSDYGFMAKYMGKTIALVAVPKLTNLYLEHINILLKYKNLLKICKKREKSNGLP